MHEHAHLAITPQEVINGHEGLVEHDLDHVSRVLSIEDLGHGDVVDTRDGYALVDELLLEVDRVLLNELVAQYERGLDLEQLFGVTNVEALLNKRKRAETGYDHTALFAHLLPNKIAHGIPYLDNVRLANAQVISDKQ